MQLWMSLLFLCCRFHSVLDHQFSPTFFQEVSEFRDRLNDAASLDDGQPIRLEAETMRGGEVATLAEFLFGPNSSLVCKSDSHRVHTPCQACPL